MHLLRPGLCTLTLLGVGCATAPPPAHHLLPTAPAPTASLEERQAYLAQHDLVDDDRPGYTLKSGAATVFPQDLKPAVPADSRTAKAIARYERDVQQIEGLRPVLLVGGSAVIAGVATAVAGTFVDEASPARNIVGTTGVLLVVAGGVLESVYFALAEPLQFDAAEAAGFVAGSYPGALRQQLAIDGATTTTPAVTVAPTAPPNEVTTTTPPSP